MILNKASCSQLGADARAKTNLSVLLFKRVVIALTYRWGPAEAKIEQTAADSKAGNCSASLTIWDNW